MMIRQLVLAAFAAAALAAPVAARELTDDEWAALEEAVVAEEAALHAKDPGAVIDAFPPAVLPLIAQMSGGVEVDVARQQGIEAMLAQAEGASLEAYDIDYDNAQGPYETADGITYVLLPTTMIELPGDGSKLKPEVTVAILLDDRWYMIGFDKSEETELLTAAYPGFAGEEFAANIAAVLGSETEATTEEAAVSEVTLSDEQMAALEERVATFDAAIRANDMATVMGVIPPKMLSAMATQFGATEEQIITSIQQAMDEALKTVTFVSFKMDLDTATIAAQSDGTPYLLIPTETVMDLGAAGGKIRATSSTLGLLDGDTWYLIRVEDPSQVALLKQIYPGLADVEFPTGSMEPVTE